MGTELEFLEELVKLTQENIYFMKGGEISRSTMTDKYQKELIMVRDFINNEIFKCFEEEDEKEI